MVEVLLMEVAEMVEEVVVVVEEGAEGVMMTREVMVVVDMRVEAATRAVDTEEVVAAEAGTAMATHTAVEGIADTAVTGDMEVVVVGVGVEAATAAEEMVAEGVVEEGDVVVVDVEEIEMLQYRLRKP
eukprot:TRINITY_DN4142_c0_g1_i1.p5 TRINITY_DN4142_c0_g1~~TRINITY_DN4142_c0_g1_i1.p5  ORF type:complete len:128 (+),score=58.65 TRINITY_DN4142_c0_g1_i1:115-498(+)